jgi:hypothetical protein
VLHSRSDERSSVHSSEEIVVILPLNHGKGVGGGSGTDSANTPGAAISGATHSATAINGIRLASHSTRAPPSDPPLKIPVARKPDAFGWSICLTVLAISPPQATTTRASTVPGGTSRTIINVR